jgi:hypothetical protein
MAEDEIIKKHTQAAYDALKHPGRKWTHKLKDILQEILIIVFAVSVSIWLHGWAEDRKDHKEEKEFFKGLREDIAADIKEMENDRSVYRQVMHHSQYFGKAAHAAVVNKDSVTQYYWIFFTQAQINPRISRFEALKGSGKLDIIEDKKILYDIIELYQKLFPNIYRSNQSFNTLGTDRIDPYIGEVLQLDTSGAVLNAAEVLRMSKMRLLLTQLYSSAANSEQAYTRGIDKSREILKELEAEGR